jgi:hypothetical protein
MNVSPQLRPAPVLALALVLAIATASPASAQRPLTLNEPVSARFSLLSSGADGWYHHDYIYTVRTRETIHFVVNAVDTSLRVVITYLPRNQVTGTFDVRPGQPVSLYAERQPGDYQVRVSSRSTGRYHISAARGEAFWLVEEESNVSGFFGLGGIGVSTLQPEGQEFEDLGVGFQFGAGIGFLDRYALFGRMIWEQLDDADENTLLTYEAGARLYFLNALSPLRPYVQLSGGRTAVERVMEDDSRATFLMGGVGLLWFMFDDGAIELGVSYGVADFGGDPVLPGRAPAGRLWLGFSWHPFD